MTHTILLTSFTTWIPHQSSNSSDDLLVAVQSQGKLPPHCHLLRQLPVATQPAFDQVRAAMDQYHPDIIVCCGMAESRSRLNLERCARQTHPARQAHHTLQTSFDLPKICQTLSLPNTDISDDAGDFVCNDLYYALLHHLAESAPGVQGAAGGQGLFVHVPPLTEENGVAIVTDFQQLLRYLSGSSV